MSTKSQNAHKIKLIIQYILEKCNHNFITIGKKVDAINKKVDINNKKLQYLSKIINHL